MIKTPILLIHGFNGAPSNWTGPSDRFPEYLASNGFDPDLIRVFSYGYDTYDGKTSYDNLGDIRKIAHRLDDPDGADAHECSVDRLSQDSVAHGGTPKVTIIAHSSGGLIARYYLTRNAEDDFGTRYRGRVGQVVFLGTPHRGVDVEDILDPLPTNSIAYRLMIRFHYLLPPEYKGQSNSFRSQFRQVRERTKKAFLGDDEYPATQTPAFEQMHPNSPFLKDINRPGAMPKDVRYYNIIGDVRAAVHIEAFGRGLIHSQKSFGDFLVTAKSAGSIPNAPSQCYPIVDEYCLSLDIGRRISTLARIEQEGSREIPIHRHLRSLPDARRLMLEILEKSELDGRGREGESVRTHLPLGQE